MLILVKKFTPDAKLPEYAHVNDGGFDLFANEETGLYPGTVRAIGTGLGFDIPTGWQLEIRPRSGVSLNTSLRVANAPGTVDSGYVGEVKILLWNSSDSTYVTVKKGDKIAQGVLTPVHKAAFQEVKELPNTDRGTNGFGSSGH